MQELNTKLEGLTPTSTGWRVQEVGREAVGGRGHLCSRLASAAHGRGRSLGRLPHTSTDSSSPRAASAETD